MKEVIGETMPEAGRHDPERAKRWGREGSPELAYWAWTRVRDILEGGAKQVGSSMRRAATVAGCPPDARKPVDTCANYLQKYAPYLQYDRYLAAGYPIATGIIEGACRHLVRDRMELTGARWRLGGAEAVLKLRVLRASGDFDAYWDFHEKVRVRTEPRTELCPRGTTAGHQAAATAHPTPPSAGQVVLAMLSQKLWTSLDRRRKRATPVEEGVEPRGAQTGSAVRGSDASRSAVDRPSLATGIADTWRHAPCASQCVRVQYVGLVALSRRMRALVNGLLGTVSFRGSAG